MTSPRIESTPSWCGPRLRISAVSGATVQQLNIDLILDEGESATIGRGDAADVKLSDGHVSRTHLILTRRGEEIAACDAGSRWGTRLNGRPLVAPTPLEHGDTLIIGASTLTFERLWDVLTRPLHAPDPARLTRSPDPAPPTAMSSGIRQLPRPVQVRPVREPPPPPSAWEQNVRIAALIVLAVCAIYFIVFIFKPM